MEVSVLSIGLTILSLSILTIGWRAVNWVWLRPKKLERFLLRQGLSGNSYRFLVGDLNHSKILVQQVNSRPFSISDDIKPRVQPYIHHVIQTHGKKSFSWEGPIPRVYIAEPQLIKEILANIHDYQKPNFNPLTNLLVKGLLKLEGDKWSMHRKIFNPAFHVGKLKLMLPAIHSSSQQMIVRWDEMLSGKESCEVDVWPYLKDLTRDVISRTAFGTSIEEGRRIFQLQEEQTQLTFTAVRSVYIPGSRFLPTESNLRMKRIDREIRSLIRDLIHRKEKAIKAGESALDDLLGLMIESNMNEIQDSSKRTGMSIDDVIEECKLFYFAGQETTSTLLVWTMVLLSVHQEWQQRAREEVLRVLGDGQPDYDQLNHLNTVMMILNEVLRLYPPVTALTRRVTKDMKLGDLTLPAGILVTMPTIHVHHDRKLWGEDATEFNPERFAEGVAKATKNQVIFFPFGWGPRICIGLSFAMLEAKLALSVILKKYRFELSPAYKHAPSSNLPQPRHGAHLILHNLVMTILFLIIIIRSQAYTRLTCKVRTWIGGNTYIANT